MSEPARAERILVVDDDPEIARIEVAYLRQAGYGVVAAHDGHAALAALTQEPPDLVLLDIMLPGRDGFELTRWMRGQPSLSRVPIILVTARVEDFDKILGLELGADDYLTKPFNPRELVARVRAVLRRSAMVQEQDPAAALEWQDLRLDPATREVRAQGRAIELTRTEFALLETFLRRPGYVHSRQALITACLGADYEGLDRTLDSHIRNLRRKIDARPAAQGGPGASHIQAVYGIGYRLLAPAGDEPPEDGLAGSDGPDPRRAPGDAPTKESRGDLAPDARGLRPAADGGAGG